jgi:hypothetical protein
MLVRDNRVNWGFVRMSICLILLTNYIPLDIFLDPFLYIGPLILCANQKISCYSSWVPCCWMIIMFFKNFPFEFFGQCDKLSFLFPDSILFCLFM